MRFKGIQAWHIQQEAMGPSRAWKEASDHCHGKALQMHEVPSHVAKEDSLCRSRAQLHLTSWQEDADKAEPGRDPHERLERLRHTSCCPVQHGQEIPDGQI